MARLIDLPYREVDPLIAELSSAGFTEELATILRRGGAKRAVEILWSVFIDQSALVRLYPLINRYFIHPDLQIRNVRKWNEQYHWGYTEEDFAKLGPPPAWPEEKQHPLGAVVLVPYRETPTRTWEDLWTCRAYCGDSADFMWSYSLRDSQEYIGLAGGTHVPNTLAWEVIDLGANRTKEGVSPLSVRGRHRTLPGAGVLAAMAHFPLWVSAIDLDRQERVPCVWVPGYDVRLPRNNGVFAPLIQHSNRHNEYLCLSFDPANKASRYYAVPEFIAQ